LNLRSFIETSPAKSSRELLLVSVSPLYGGAETYYVKLAFLLRECFNLRAVVCNDQLAVELEELGVSVVRVVHSGGFDRYFAAARAIYRSRSIGQHQVAHLNGQPEVYLAPLLRLLGVRVVATRHTPFTNRFFQEGSSIPVAVKRWIVSFCLQFSYRVVCVSRLLESQLSGAVGPARLVVIPTWVPDRFLRQRTAPQPSSIFRILFVGRVVANKGIFDLIEAVKLLSSVCLDVVGTGDQLEEAKELAVGYNVTFHGFHRDCVPFYAACDLLVFPAREGFEGLPQVPLEAMAMGVPCLGSNISSMREILGESLPASMLFNEGDPEDLARKIAIVRDSPTLREYIAKAGALRVAQSYTEQIVRGQYFLFFDSAFAQDRQVKRSNLSCKDIGR
jgi:glycosyltransferase involved in cell wall biosynthesis